MDLSTSNVISTKLILATYILRQKLKHISCIEQYEKKYNITYVDVAKMVEGSVPVPPKVYDLILNVFGSVLCVPVTIICASCIYTNIWYGTQKDLVFPKSILLMCTDGKLSVVHMFNSTKIKLGRSPLYEFTKCLKVSNPQRYIEQYQADIGAGESANIEIMQSSEENSGNLEQPNDINNNENEGGNPSKQEITESKELVDSHQIAVGSLLVEIDLTSGLQKENDADMPEPDTTSHDDEVIAAEYIGSDDANMQKECTSEIEVTKQAITIEHNITLQSKEMMETEGTHLEDLILPNKLKSDLQQSEQNPPTFCENQEVLTYEVPMSSNGISANSSVQTTGFSVDRVEMTGATSLNYAPETNKNNAVPLQQAEEGRDMPNGTEKQINDTDNGTSKYDHVTSATLSSNCIQSDSDTSISNSGLRDVPTSLSAERSLPGEILYSPIGNAVKDNDKDIDSIESNTANKPCEHEGNVIMDECSESSISHTTLKSRPHFWPVPVSQPSSYKTDDICNVPTSDHIDVSYFTTNKQIRIEGLGSMELSAESDSNVKEIAKAICTYSSTEEDPWDIDVGKMVDSFVTTNISEIDRSIVTDKIQASLGLMKLSNRPSTITNITSPHEEHEGIQDIPPPKNTSTDCCTYNKHVDRSEFVKTWLTKHHGLNVENMEIKHPNDSDSTSAQYSCKTVPTLRQLTQQKLSEQKTEMNKITSTKISMPHSISDLDGCHDQELISNEYSNSKKIKEQILSEKIDEKKCADSTQESYTEPEKESNAEEPHLNSNEYSRSNKSNAEIFSEKSDDRKSAHNAQESYLETERAISPEQQDLDSNRNSISKKTNEDILSEQSDDTNSAESAQESYHEPEREITPEQQDLDSNRNSISKKTNEDILSEQSDDTNSAESAQESYHEPEREITPEQQDLDSKDKRNTSHQSNKI